MMKLLSLNFGVLIDGDENTVIGYSKSGSGRSVGKSEYNIRKENQSTDRFS